MGIYNLSHDSGRSDRPQDPEWFPEDTGDGKHGRIPVAVNADFTSDGILLPRKITREDGRQYRIDLVIGMERQKSRKEGGAGMRYTCLVSDHPVTLFYEGNGCWDIVSEL